MNKVVTKGRKSFAEQSISEFLKSSKVNGTTKEIYEAYTVWGESSGHKVASFNTFKIMYSSNPSLRIIRKESFVPVETKKDYIPLKEQFFRLEKYIDAIIEGYYSALYIHGDSGIGKTQSIENAVARAKDKSIFVSLGDGGDLKGAADLAKILYNNKDGKVIIFDDFDSILEKKNCLGIMKAALNDKKTRTISWVDGTKRAKKDTIPSTFTFTSRVIVISNKTKINPTLKNRFLSCKIEIEKHDALNWIRENFNSFETKIPLEYRNEVADFIEENITKFRTVDFRMFKKILFERFIDMSNKDHSEMWKRVALKEIA